MTPALRFARTGTYSGQAASSCTPCGLGKFAEGRAGDSCSFCDEVLFGSITAEEGSSSADMCICTAGFYAPAAEEEDAKCTICPAGSDCAEPGATVATLQLEPGHWRSSNESTEILQCDNEEACAPSCDAETPGRGYGSASTGLRAREPHHMRSTCAPHESPRLNSYRRETAQGTHFHSRRQSLICAQCTRNFGNAIVFIKKIESRSPC